MTKEEKELVLNDLCARLPYGVHVEISWEYSKTDVYTSLEYYEFPNIDSLLNIFWDEKCISIKPYLRPMSSMTEEEKREFQEYVFESNEIGDIIVLGADDWLNKNKFDYRGLIEKGLALPAPEGMYFQQKSDDELKKDVAKKLIDVLIYDNDYVNRMTPLDESRHYGNWIDYVAKSVTFPDSDKEWWYKEDRINIFADGDYHNKEDMIKNYPSLRELDTVLNEYYDYLNEEFKI